MEYTLEIVMGELEKLGKERIKKNYISQGAREPLFGVATGEMKPLFKAVGKNCELARALYATGNYDAMYFAGMIAEPNRMSRADFERWIAGAYFYMISDYIVAVTLAETTFAAELAEDWIKSADELTASAGWSCYAWLLGSRPDEEFLPEKLAAMLADAEKNIRSAPNRVKYSMNNFVISVGVSYPPLHREAVRVAVSSARWKSTWERHGAKLRMPQHIFKTPLTEGA